MLAAWRRLGFVLSVGMLAASGPNAAVSQQVGGQTGSPSARQLVAPPPAFTETCRRYDWLCEHGGAGSLTPAELMGAAERINRQVNRTIDEMTDVENYGSIDRWALPTNGRGDCEDFVLEKYRLLLAAGADSHDLSIAVVLDRNGDNHAVLVLRHAMGDLILDNLEHGIRPWNQTEYRYLAMQASDDKRLWQVVMHQPRDRTVLAER